MALYLKVQQFQNIVNGAKKFIEMLVSWASAIKEITWAKSNTSDDVSYEHIRPINQFFAFQGSIRVIVEVGYERISLPNCF